MNNIIQMLLQNKMQQIPQQLIGQLEKNLKATNPQAFQKYQEARKNNNPEELLNETVNNFNSQQRQQWEQMMGMFNQQNTQQK